MAVTELGGAQISNLLEALPGIAQVLRSPVADALVKLIRLAGRSAEFTSADAEELLNYAVRRNLMSTQESGRLLAEVQEQIRVRGERAQAKQESRAAAPAKAKAAAKAKAKSAAKAAAAKGKGKGTASAKSKSSHKVAKKR